jgi:hypothetical protein
MVVWDDTRNAAKGYTTDIYAQQLDWGNLCGDNLPVYIGSGEQRFPDIAYGTTNNLYQVVWEDNRAVSWDVYAQMLAPNGLTIGNSIALAASASSSQNHPRVAYDAEFTNEFTTTWQDNRTGNLDIYSRSTNGSGGVLPATIAVRVTATNERLPAIAFGNTSNHYFIAWAEGAQIRGRALWK